MSAASWVVLLAAVLVGGFAGVRVNRAAGAFPWSVGPSAPEGPVAVRTATRPAVRPPVVEVGTAALCGTLALRFGATWELPAFLLLAVAGVLLGVVDAQHRLLPNRVVLPALGGGAALLLVAAAATGEWAALTRAGLGAAALFTALFVLALISPAGMGMGDVKLAAVLGLYLGWLGWPVLVTGAFLGFAVQAVAALVLLAAGRAGRKSELPFGPALLAGALAAVLLSGEWQGLSPVG